MSHYPTDCALGAAALAYAARGWRVLPLHARDLIDGTCDCPAGAMCVHPGAHPVADLAPPAATDDRTTIEQWWTEYPDAGVGVVMGPGSGLLGIEYTVDVPPELTGLLDHLVIDAPPTVIADGGAYGVALLACSEPVPSQRLGPGLRLLGDGCVVPMPPSISDRGRLAWSDEASPPPALPLDVTEVDALAARLRAGVAVRTERMPSGTIVVGAARPVVVRLSSVQPREARWLWEGYVPYGAITILQGHPGGLKSTITIDLAARVTTGAPPPLGDEPLERGTVILVGREDGLAETVRPRLDAAGADVTRVLSVCEVDDDGQRRPLALPQDLHVVEAVCCAHDARLVVIDPIVAYLAEGRHALTDHGVRGALEPLAQLAQRLGIAVVLVRHLTKRGTGPALHHGSGSIGLAAIARSVLQVDRGPEGAVLKSVKSSLGPPPAPVIYRLESVGHVARVEWVGVASACPDEARPPTKLERAKALLLEALESGPVACRDLKDRAQTAEISWRTFEQAKQELGVVAKKQSRQSYWALRTSADDGDDCGAADSSGVDGEEP